MKTPKLTSEMIPGSLWGMSLPNHLERARWDKLRRACYAQAGNVCEICGGVGSKDRVDCHEVWEYDDQNRIQKLLGLTALCPACHLVKHYGRACAIGKRAEAQNHLAKVNGWTLEQTQEHVVRMKLLWAKRSKQQWTQDITWVFDQP
jgi:hypothetical protein